MDIRIAIERKWISIKSIMNIPQSGLNEERVQEIQNMLTVGQAIKPIRVRKAQKGKYYLKDGGHRIEAHNRHTIDRISAEIYP